MYKHDFDFMEIYKTMRMIDSSQVSRIILRDTKKDSNIRHFPARTQSDTV